MQLVAYGAQDVYLTGNPQITFWKVVYRRHTNFAVESIEQVFNGTGDFGKKVVCQIQRNGDLITKMYLRVVLPALSNGSVWCSKVGHAMLKTIELNIGGTTIDKHWGDWFNVWYELARKFAHDRGYDQMIGNTAELTTTMVGVTAPATLYVPLYFFHCRNDGLALPLIATQYHDTRIEIEFNPLAQLLCGTSASVPAVTMGSCSLYVDYVYLDSEERKKFAQASHEYLIEQLQFTGAESVTSQSSKFRLNFNHPCKELVWNVQQNVFTSGQNAFLAYNPKDWHQTKVDATKRAAMAWGTWDNSAGMFVGNSAGLALDVKITNAKVTMSDISVGYYVLGNLVVLGDLLTDDLVSTPVSTTVSGAPQLSTLTGATRATSGDARVALDVFVRQWDNYGVFLNRTINPCDQVLLQLNGQDRFSVRDAMYFNYVQPWQCHSNTPADGVNVYSFALNPEEHQPSGTCNMSRIDNATLNVSFIKQANVYAANQGASSVIVSPYTNSVCNIYATNYNVLRIMSGMAGLAYSN